MNWEMIGALGEAIGAIAVVLTLFYLAHQVRVASGEAQRSRWMDLHAEITRVADSWGVEGELAEIMLRGFHDIESLSPTEAFRFYSSLFRMFKAWEAILEYSKDGGLPDWAASGFRTTMSDILSFPGSKVYWENRRHWYSTAFQAEVDAIQAESGERSRMTPAYGVDA